MPLPDDLLELLRAPSPCFLTTLMSDGSPQITEVWVDTDGEHVVVNTWEGALKLRNVRRDPRVAVAVADPEDFRRYFSVRGEVVTMTTVGANDHINELSQKYIGTDYPGFGPDVQRIRLVIKADRVGGVAAR
ncbi:MAG TPA: TIGR03618 family F420-dependent PPOX class oxidoreductase [Solirubrobacteraceae bacterium]|jgi:PPOX class probable F420-dependent enzyme